MPRRGTAIVPHDTQHESSIRAIYVQNLVDLLHVCLLRQEIERARRAWAILVSLTALIPDSQLTARSVVVRSIGGQDGIGVCSSSNRRASPSLPVPRPAILKPKAKDEKLNAGSNRFESRPRKSRWVAVFDICPELMLETGPSPRPRPSPDQARTTPRSAGRARNVGPCAS